MNDAGAEHGFLVIFPSSVKHGSFRKQHHFGPKISSELEL